MKKSEWEDAFVKGGPQDLLEQLISSGYPWGMLGKRLKEIDAQFKDVTNEYSQIYDLIENLDKSISQIQERQSDTPKMVRGLLREEVGSLQNRWLIGAGSLIIGAIGLSLTVLTSSSIMNFLENYGPVVGVVGMLAAAMIFAYIWRQK